MGRGPAPAVAASRKLRLREAAPTRDGCRFDEERQASNRIPPVLYYDRALFRQLRRCDDPGGVKRRTGDAQSRSAGSERTEIAAWDAGKPASYYLDELAIWRPAPLLSTDSGRKDRENDDA